MAEARPASLARPPEAASPERAPLTDWMLRPFEATGVAPYWIGIAIALAYFVLRTAGRLLLDGQGALPARLGSLAEGPWLGIDAVSGIFLGYVPTAACYLRRGALRDLRELRPVLDLGDAQFAALVERATCAPPARLALAGATAAALFSLMPLADPAFWLGGEKPPLLDPRMLIPLAQHALMGWMIGHAFVAEYRCTREFAQLGTCVQVDLIDLRPLRPFARKALRTSFIWIVGVSLVSLFWLGPAPGSANGPGMVAAIALMLLGTYRTVSGVHQSIRAAKHARLDELREQIREEGERELRAEPDRPAGARLANLIAYQDLIQRVREWPFDTAGLLRIGLFVLLGLSSWLGSALVERMLDVALD